MYNRESLYSYQGGWNVVDEAIFHIRRASRGWSVRLVL